MNPPDAQLSDKIADALPTAFHCFQDPKFAEAAEKMIRERAVAIEGLTEKQIGDALLQAVACGDFVRQVRVDNNAQTVIYLPYQEREALRSRIKALEEAAKAAVHFFNYCWDPASDKPFELLKKALEVENPLPK